MAEEEEDIEILMSRNGLIDDVLYWPDAEDSGGGGGGGDTGQTLTQVVYTSAVTAPSISDDTIYHPLAEYAPAEGEDEAVAVTGVIGGVMTVSGLNAPRIRGSVIELVAPVVEQYTASVPDDGEDGWILSAYMPMIMASDGSGDLLVSFRQLMRIHNGKLQVNFQRAIAPTGAWENYFGS